MHASFVLGYDSDDEEDNNSKSTRRIRGKKYTSLPKDDSFDQHSHRVNGANGHHVNNHQKSESVEYYIKKTHEGSETDSEYGSDKESPSKTSYVKQERQPGGIQCMKLCVFSINLCLHYIRFIPWTYQTLQGRNGWNFF